MTTYVTSFYTFTAMSTSLHFNSGALKFYKKKSNASLGSGQSRFNILDCFLYNQEYMSETLGNINIRLQRTSVCICIILAGMKPVCKRMIENTFPEMIPRNIT